MSARIASGLQGIIGLYLKSLPTINILVGLVAIWILSIPARRSIGTWWLIVLLLVTLVIIPNILQALLLLRHLTLRATFVLGKPAFGDAGGAQARLIRATARAADDVRITFAPESAAFMNHMAILDEKVTPLLLRSAFSDARRKAGKDERTILSEWKNAWTEIQRTPFDGDGATLEQIRRNHRYALLTIPFWLASSALLASAFLDIFILAALWFAYRWIEGSASLLPLSEVAALFSVASALWTFTNRPYRARTAEFTIPSADKLSKLGVTDPELLAQVAAVKSRAVRPLKVRLGPRYLKELMRLSVRALVFDGTVKLISLGILFGVALAGGLLFGSNAHQLLLTYWRMFAAVSVAMAFLIIGYYLISLAIQDLKRAIAPLVIGILVGGQPLLGQFFLTGNVGGNPQAVSSAIALGAVGIAAAVLAEFAKSWSERGGRKTTSGN